MLFPADQPPEPPVSVTIRLPAELLDRIDQDVLIWNKRHPASPSTRTERVTYLLGYAYDAGELNQFIDLMKAQYIEMLSRSPTDNSWEGPMERMSDQVNEIEDKINMLLSRPAIPN